MSTRYKWEHVGGGTALTGDNDEYPCDDEYEHIDTKERVVAICTMDAHFKMPRRVRSPAELKRRKGVWHLEYRAPLAVR